MRNSAKPSLPESPSPESASPTYKRGAQMTPGDLSVFTPSSRYPVRVRSRLMPRDAHMLPHHHAWAQVGYCASGVIQISVHANEAHNHDATYIVPPSRAVWIAPNAQHSINITQSAEVRTLYIEASAIAEQPRQEQALPSQHWQHCRVLRVSAFLRELIAALDDIKDFDSPRAEHLSQLILDELRQAPTEALSIPMPKAQTADRRLRALCDAVLHNPQQHSDLAAWSTSVGASERTMHRLFSKELGMSFAQWKNQVILAQALPLLTQGHSVAHVAAATGYHSTSAFSTMFKTAMGQSPSTFAKLASESALNS